MLIVAKREGANIKVYTVSLFGHRKINDLRQIKDKIFPILKELIRTKEYVTFFVGRNGEFDEYVASIIKGVQNETGRENNEMILVLPYTVENVEYYEKYYDSVLIPEDVCGVYPKAAITIKNRWMIERSDLVIAYVEKKQGGAYDAIKYAEKINKKVINIVVEEKK